MFHQVGYNDLVFLGSISYSCIDLMMEWNSFSYCSKPIHKWLSVSCLCAMSFRLLCMLISMAANAEASGNASNSSRPIGGTVGELLLDVRHKGFLPRALAVFTWTAVVPFFVFWNLLGTAWLWEVYRETPTCMPTPIYLYFSGAWLFLCHFWFIVHAALAMKAKHMEHRVQHAEANMREIEDPETLERWGQISSYSQIRALSDTALSRSGGLNPAAIRALPCEVAGDSKCLLEVCQRDCSICLANVEPGESVRCLPRCGHTFHRACIDLWLVRRSECPLCKQEITEQ
jgi:E3 ubiquitin-protein ligase SIS3